MGSLAYFLGAPLARDSIFNPIRNFVVTGNGTRHVLLFATRDAEYRNDAWPPYAGESGGYVIPFRIAQMEFLVDLTEGESNLAIVEAKAQEKHGDVGWRTLPPRR